MAISRSIVADQHLTRGDRFQAGHHAQRGGLAATGRSDQHEEFLVADLKVHVFDGVRVVIHLIQIAD
jgi:hypothetical protein